MTGEGILTRGESRTSRRRLWMSIAKFILPMLKGIFSVVDQVGASVSTDFTEMRNVKSKPVVAIAQGYGITSEC
jgi:hypothetical protein